MVVYTTSQVFYYNSISYSSSFIITLLELSTHKSIVFALFSLKYDP